MVKLRVCGVTSTSKTDDCDREPLVPVMVTVKALAVGEVISSVAVACPSAISSTLVGLRVTVGPVGETVASRSMMPVKPLMLLRVIVDLPVWLVGMAIVFGMAVMLKVGAGVTVRVMALEWTSGPLVPVTVTT